MDASNDTSVAQKDVCEAHEHHHLGICGSCGGCRCCPPLDQCESKDSHVSSKIGCPSQTHRTTVTTPSTTSWSSKRLRESDVDYAEGDDDSSLPQVNDLFTIQAAVVIASPTATKKDKVKAILQLLCNFENNVRNLWRIPATGIANVQECGQQVDAARRIIDSVVSVVCLLLVSDAADVGFLKNQ
jgi:hypothetical protein